MLQQLGSIPFSREYLSEDTVGHWVIEKDHGREPRMYADDVMLGLIGLTGPASPEDTFRAWLAGIDENYMDSVMETERLNVNGIRAEVQYPWHYPDGRTIMIRCEGIRNYAYSGGFRTEGRHEDITKLIHIQKEAAVIAALSADFEVVNYVILRENKLEDVVISYRISDRIRRLIPVWENETSFHNILELVINHLGHTGDIDSFYTQTRRDVIVSHLEHEPAYYVNTRAVVENGKIEYFQFKFTADRDDKGRLIGLVVGVHSVDKEMRDELQLRESVEKLVAEQTEELKFKNRALAKVNERIISMIGSIVEYRDEESGSHINRVKYLTRILGMQVMKDLPEYNLTVEDITAIASMSPLHDVGKIKIPDSILLKPEAFTQEEFDIMKTHCEQGAEILREMYGAASPEMVKLSVDICLYHHEKWDGGGYPFGLKEDEIPIAAQIVSIADAYDALVSERCYKEAFSHDKAYSMIMNGDCGMFSDKLLACFSKCKAAFASNVTQPEIEENEEPIYLAADEFISDAVPLIEKVSEAMPGGFFIYQADEDEKFIYFNNLMVNILGCTSRKDFIDFTGNSFKGMVYPDDYEYLKSDIERNLDGGKKPLGNGIFRIRRRNGGARWINGYGRFIRSRDLGDVFFVFFTDLSGKLDFYTR